MAECIDAIRWEMQDRHEAAEAAMRQLVDAGDAWRAVVVGRLVGMVVGLLPEVSEDYRG